MPRVKIVSLGAGPDGVRHPGEIHDVSEAEGRDLVAARAATWHERPRESAVITAPENAALATQAPPPRGRR